MTRNASFFFFLLVDQVEKNICHHHIIIKNFLVKSQISSGFMFIFTTNLWVGINKFNDNKKQDTKLFLNLYFESIDENVDELHELTVHN